MEQMEWKSSTVSSSPEKENRNSNWLRTKKALDHVLFKMRRRSLTPKQAQPLNKHPQRAAPLSVSLSPQPTCKIRDFPPPCPVSDRISVLSDEILLNILSKLPISQKNANFLVCKRWLDLQGRLVRSIKVLEWEFLVSGRLFVRFPNLTHIDLANGCRRVSSRNSGIVCSRRRVSFDVGSDAERKDWSLDDSPVLNHDEVDRGLRVLASGCPNLKNLVVANSSEMGLLSVAEECPTLQELELLMCNDQVVRGIAACQSLQILRLNGYVEGLFTSLVSDVGLTILAQGCKRLVKIELNGCAGGYEGIKAIGQCSQMLEELTLRNHKMENGWLFSLSYCENLRALRFISCKNIDGDTEIDDHLGSCPAVERLHMEKCQLRDKKSLRALFLVCHNVRKLVVKNCWGLTDDIFSTSTVLRKLRFLSIESCSMLTTRGLELVIVSWNELQSLKVHSCNNIKDDEISPTLSRAFSALKDLKWKPNSKSTLSSNLQGANMGKRGGKFFKKSLVTGNLSRTSESSIFRQQI